MIDLATLQRSSRPVALLAQFIAIYLACLAGHVLWVSLYGVDLPILDQWEAELYYLQALAKAGTLDFAHIVYPWNEHRIAITRLISLVLFKSNNDQFDGLVECYVNAAIFAAMPCLILCGLEWKNRAQTRIFAIALLAVCLSWLPYDFENTLIGFQNQFYLMELSAVLLIALAAWATITPTLWLLCLLITTISYFTMASGLMGGIAAAAVLAGRQFTEPRSRPGLALAAALVISFLVSLYFVPRVPANLQFRAIGIVEHVRAFAFVMGWPLSSHKWLFPALWLPAVTALIKGAFTRRLTPNQMMALGLCCWVTLQAAAIAHSRGHNLSEIPSRYSDIMTVGLIANGWLGIDAWVSHRKKSQTKLVALVMAVSATFGIVGIYAFVHRTPADFIAMTQHYQRQLDGTQNLRRYLSGGDRQALAPPAMIPLPDSKRLQMILGSDYIRDILPPSIRPPLTAFTNDASTVIACLGNPSGIVLLRSQTATAGPIETAFPYLLATTMEVDDLLSHATNANRSALECNFPYATAKLRFVTVATSPRSFRVSGQNTGKRPVLLTAPVELGTLSRSALLFRGAVCHGTTKLFEGSCRDMGRSGQRTIALSVNGIQAPSIN